MDNFSKNVARLRKEHGWTQMDLAERCFVATSTVKKWEKGIVYPHLLIAVRLAKVFDVPLEDIVEGDYS